MTNSYYSFVKELTQ